MSYLKNHKWTGGIVSCLLLGVAWSTWPSDRVGSHPGMKNATKTTRVAGKVLVNGVPADGVHIYLVPIEGQSRIRPYAQSKSDGTFAISTNIDGDGAPPGEYKLTMRWIENNSFKKPQIVRQRRSETDLFKGRYADPAKSAFRLSVGTSPIKNLTFELSNEQQADVE